MKSHHAIKLLFFLALLLSSTTFPSWASSDPKKPKIVVAGEIKGIRSRIENGTVFSYVSFFIVHVKNGSGSMKNTEITIRCIGGGIGTTVLVRSDQAYFFVGEKAQVTIEEEGQVFKVVGGRRGKAQLDENFQVITQRTAAGYRLTWFRPPSEFQASTTRPGPDWYGPLEWSDSQLPVTYWIDTRYIPSGIGEAAFVTHARQCYQNWADDPGSYIDYAYGGTKTNTEPGQDDGFNLFAWRYIDGSGGTLGVAYTWCTWIEGNYDSLRITDSDIELDTGDAWSAADTCPPNRFDVQNVGTHEVGHTVQLADLYDAEDSAMTMYGFSGLGETEKRSLAWGDQAGVRILYPSSYTVTTTTTTTSSTTTSYGTTRITTTATSTTTSMSTTASTTFLTTTSTHWSSGATSTTYTTRTTSYSTIPTFTSTTTSSSSGTSSYTSTQLSKTGTATSTQYITTTVTSDGTIHITVTTRLKFVEQFLERIISTLSSWFSQLIQILQRALVVQTEKEIVVKVEPELYPRGTTRILFDASPKPGTMNNPVTFSGTLLGSWRPIRDGMVVNRPVEVRTGWGFGAVVNTDDYGRFAVSTTCPSMGGFYDITATFYEDQDLEGNSTTISYQVIEYIETTLTLSHRYESGGMGGARRFYGYLREKNTGNPVPGKTVRLTIYSGGYAFIFDITTNSQGYYDYLFTGNSGIFTWAESRFAGSGMYLPSYSGRISAAGGSSSAQHGREPSEPVSISRNPDQSIASVIPIRQGPESIGNNLWIHKGYDRAQIIQPQTGGKGSCRFVLDASPKPGYVNQPVTISGTMYGSWGPIKDGMVVGKSLTITANWGFSTTVTTDYYGHFSTTTNCPPTANTYTITVTFTEDEDLTGNSASINYQVLEFIETTLTLTHRYESGGMGGARRFYGYLREKNTGNPVPGKTVRLTIYSGGYAFIFDITTNSQGYYDYLFTGNSGIFTWAEARFAGSGLYLPSFSGRIYP